MFTGAMTALVTPMNQGTIDNNALEHLIEEQIQAGISALILAGTTGEAAALSFDERISLIQRTITITNQRIPIIAGAGHNCTQQAVDLSKAYEDSGVDGLLHVAPYYNKPTQQGLIKHFTTIADNVSVPIILYNVPSRTASDILPETTHHLANHPRIVGIKDATANLERGTELLSLLGNRMAVLSGDDFSALPLYSIGGQGVISVTANIVPTLITSMWTHVQNNNYKAARDIHYKIYRLTQLLFKESNPIGIKAALALCGKIKPEIRAPLCEATPLLQNQLKEILKTMELLP